MIKFYCILSIFIISYAGISNDVSVHDKMPLSKMKKPPFHKEEELISFFFEKLIADEEIPQEMQQNLFINSHNFFLSQKENSFLMNRQWSLFRFARSIFLGTSSRNKVLLQIYPLTRGISQTIKDSGKYKSDFYYFNALNDNSSRDYCVRLIMGKDFPEERIFFFPLIKNGKYFFIDTELLIYTNFSLIHFLHITYNPESKKITFGKRQEILTFIKN